MFGGEGITVPVLPKLVWLTWNGFLLSVASFGSFVGSRYLIPSHYHVYLLTTTTLGGDSFGFGDLSSNDGTGIFEMGHGHELVTYTTLYRKAS